MNYILVINLGSTSSKLGIFKEEEEVVVENIHHSVEELAKYTRIVEQYPLRRKVLIDFIERNGFSLSQFMAIACRGTATKPVEAGVYRVTKKMVDDFQVEGEHPTGVGLILAYNLAEEFGIPAYTLDSPLSDELEPIARISGIPEIQRKSKFHALNQKDAGRKAAKAMGKQYEEMNLIIAHIGGGISIGAHRRGRVIDVNNALDGDGPFSPERSGGLPVGDLVKLCFSGKFTEREILKKITGKGGLVAYLGTNNALEVEKRILDGDKEAELIYQAMAYQIAKEIGAMATVFKGEVDAIVITGALAKSDMLVNWIKERVRFIAPIILLPGADEMRALAVGALRALKGEVEVKVYN